MNFEQLVTQIEFLHNELQLFAVRQVNNMLTMRNILIGYYIVEYEQNGADRAEYGANTMNALAARLKHIKGFSTPQLYKFRDFYLGYPQIFSTVLRKLQNITNQNSTILSTVLIKLPQVTETSSRNELEFEHEMLLSRLSFSHFIELLSINEPLKRTFYEVQSVKNNWGPANWAGQSIPCFTNAPDYRTRFLYRNTWCNCQAKPNSKTL